MKNKSTNEMWQNALTQTDEKYIAEAAELAPESDNIAIQTVPEKGGTGNLGFVFAAAAAVIVSFVGVGIFLNRTGIEPLSPSAGSIGTSSTDDGFNSADDGISGTMTSTIVMNENGEIVTIVSKSDAMDAATVEIPTTPPETEKRPLTLADVVTLSQKGDSLTWSDFDSFEGKETGSGLYIMCYEINDEYIVMVGGVPTETPWYIRLIRNFGKDNEEYIDIRTDDVLKFLSKASEPSSNSLYDIKGDVLYISDKVTEISEYMFMNNNDFTQVSIPASVTKIGDYAFAHCSLENVVFEGNVEIGNYAFCDCTKLKQAVFLNDVAKIGDYAFNNCSLNDVALPDSFVNLGMHSFLGNKNINISWHGKNYDNDHLYDLTTDVADSKKLAIASEYVIKNSVLTIPEGVTEIEPNAFQGADNFTEVVLPSTLTKIGEYAFAESKIKKINLPDSLTEIGDYAFYMSSLEKISIPSGVKEIGYSTFDRCGNLTSVTLNSGLEKIGERAFMSCNALSEIIIPDTVTSIDSDAFFGSGLFSVTIPASVTALGTGVFSNCVFLESVSFEGSLKNIPEQCFSSCTSLRSVKLPEGVRIISAGAFCYCTSLEIVLPNSVSFIADSAFEGCTQFDGTIKPKPVVEETTDDFSLIRPVDSTFISSDFIDSTSPDINSHDGIDYPGEIGNNIYAAADGIVTAIQTDLCVGKDQGKYVIIDHGNGFTTCYTHLDSISVKMLDEISQGDVIGRMGNTGLSTGPHLHFVLARNGEALDPHIYLGDPIQLIQPTGGVNSEDNILYEYGEYEGHKGIDYAGEKGQDVSAAAYGKVTYAGWNADYGNCVIIDHRNGYQTLYGHLDEIKVEVGDLITTGHVVGTMGATGVVTGVQLHFELLKDGENLNPADYIVK